MKSQTDSEETYGKRFKMKDRLIQDSSGIVWVPNDDAMLKLRILIAAHAGISGRRGIKVTATTVMQVLPPISCVLQREMLSPGLWDIACMQISQTKFFTLTSAIYRKAGHETAIYLY